MAYLLFKDGDDDVMYTLAAKDLRHAIYEAKKVVNSDNEPGHHWYRICTERVKTVPTVHVFEHEGEYPMEVRF